MIMLIQRFCPVKHLKLEDDEELCGPLFTPALSGQILVILNESDTYAIFYKGAIIPPNRVAEFIWMGDGWQPLKEKRGEDNAN